MKGGASTGASTESVNQKDRYGNTALINAVIQNNLGMVKLLLEQHGVDINLQNKCGSTALLWAVSNENIEIIKWLLDHDRLNMNLQDERGDTALMIAVRKKNIEMAELLLGRDGVDMNLQNKDGDTLMYTAIESQDRGLVQLLISKGVEHISKNNCTMLHDDEECNLDGNEVAEDPIMFIEIDMDNKENYYRLATTGHCIHKDTYDRLDPKIHPLTREPIRCLGYL